MKGLNFKLDTGSLKNFVAKFGKNLAWLFFASFLLLVLFEIFELNQSLRMFLAFNSQPAVPMVKDKGVRINFDDYQTVVKRIQDAPNFKPAPPSGQNPFNLK